MDAIALLLVTQVFQNASSVFGIYTFRKIWGFVHYHHHIDNSFMYMRMPLSEAIHSEGMPLSIQQPTTKIDTCTLCLSASNLSTIHTSPNEHVYFDLWIDKCAWIVASQFRVNRNPFIAFKHFDASVVWCDGCIKTIRWIIMYTFDGLKV